MKCEVGARALRVRSEVRGDGQVRLCNALGCDGRGCLKPIRRVVLWSQHSFSWRPPRGGLSVAPRESGGCWKQPMMFLEGIRIVAMAICDLPIPSPPLTSAGICCYTALWRRQLFDVGISLTLEAI